MSGGVPERLADALGDFSELAEYFEHARHYMYRRVETVTLGQDFAQSWDVRVTVEPPIAEVGASPPRRWLIRAAEGVDADDPSTWEAVATAEQVVIDLDGTPLPVAPEAWDDAPTPRVLSLGLFPKDRLADLEVLANGQPVYPLSNDEISRILGLSFAHSVRVRLSAHPKMAAIVATAEGRQVLEEAVDLIRSGATEVVQVDATAGAVRVKELQASCLLLARLRSADPHLDRLRSVVYDILGHDQTMWSRLEPLAKHVHVLVEVDLRPRRLCELHLSYTDTTTGTFGEIINDQHSGEREHAVLLKEAERIVALPPDGRFGRMLASLAEAFLVAIDRSVALLAGLGLVGTPMRFTRPNADHCVSYYFLLDLPDDMECVRFYWRDLEHEVIDRSHPPVATSHPVLAGHWLTVSQRLRRWECIAELQIRKDARLRAMAVFTAFAAIISGYLFRNVPPHGNETQLQVVIGLAALIVVVPAGLLQYVSQSASRLASRSTRYLNWLVSAVGVSTSALALALAIVRTESDGVFKLLAISASTVSCLTALVLAGILLLPRHGQPESRRPRVDADRTGRSVASLERFRQRRAALVWLAGSIVATEVWWQALHVRGGNRLSSREAFDQLAWEALQRSWFLRPIVAALDLGGLVLLGGVLLAGLLLVVLRAGSGRRRTGSSAERAPEGSAEDGA